MPEVAAANFPGAYSIDASPARAPLSMTMSAISASFFPEAWREGVLAACWRLVDLTAPERIEVDVVAVATPAGTVVGEEEVDDEYLRF